MRKSWADWAPIPQGVGSEGEYTEIGCPECGSWNAVQLVNESECSCGTKFQFCRHLDDPNLVAIFIRSPHATKERQQ